MFSLTCLQLSDMGSLLGGELLLHFSELSQEAILLFFYFSTMAFLLRRQLFSVRPVLTLLFFSLLIQVLSVLPLNFLALAEPVVLFSIVSVTEFSKFLVLLIDLLMVSSFLFVLLV